jgi:hypothetical protein
MDYGLKCECGNELRVSEGAAGVAFPCSCGRTIVVPELTQLRQFAASGQIRSLPTASAEPSPPPSRTAEAFRGTVLLVIGTILLVVLGLCLVYDPRSFARIIGALLRIVSRL